MASVAPKPSDPTVIPNPANRPWVYCKACGKNCYCYFQHAQLNGCHPPKESPAKHDFLYNGHAIFADPPSGIIKDHVPEEDTEVSDDEARSFRKPEPFKPNPIEDPAGKAQNGRYFILPKHLSEPGARITELPAPFGRIVGQYRWFRVNDREYLIQGVGHNVTQESRIYWLHRKVLKTDKIDWIDDEGNHHVGDRSWRSVWPTGGHRDSYDAVIFMPLTLEQYTAWWTAILEGTLPKACLLWTRFDRVDPKNEVKIDTRQVDFEDLINVQWQQTLYRAWLRKKNLPFGFTRLAEYLQFSHEINSRM